MITTKKIEAIRRGIEEEILKRKEEVQQMIEEVYYRNIFLFDVVNFYVEVEKNNKIEFGYVLNKNLKENQIEFFRFEKGLKRLAQIWDKNCIIENITYDAEEDEELTTKDTKDFNEFIEFVEKNNTQEKIEEIYTQWADDTATDEKALDHILVACDKFEDWSYANEEILIANEKENIEKIIDENESDIIDYIIDIYKENVNTGKEYDIFLNIDNKGEINLDYIEKEESYLDYGDWYIYTVKSEKTEEVYTDDEDFISSMKEIYDIEIPEGLEKTDKIEFLKTKYTKECAEAYADILNENYTDVAESIVNQIKNKIKNA